MTSRPLRPILPTPSRNPPQPPNTARYRATKASVACTACRTRRCVGGISCDYCRRTSVACVVDVESDGRKKGALEARLHALRRDHTLLLGLVRTLAENDGETGRILNVIQSNASLDEIRDLLEHRRPPGGEAGDEGVAYNGPLCRVPAQPWTSLTDDSDYVSHLISLYFTWGHPVHTWIERDLFLRDMEAGSIECSFCSPFLVNAILAVACAHLDPSTAGELPVGSILPDGPAFSNEAKRLLDQDQGRISLTNFQGRCDLYVSLWARGKHMAGWQYLVEITSCVTQLVAQRNAASAKTDAKSQELVRASETAINGVSSLLPVTFPAMHQSLMLPKPTYRPHQGIWGSDEGLWYPYPTAVGPMPEHADRMVNASVELQLILWEISKAILAESGSFTPATANGYLRRLHNWAGNLPQSILRYHSAIISVRNAVDDDDYTSNTNSHHLPFNPKALALSSARATCSLLERFASQPWPAKYMPVTFVRYADLALSALLGDLGNPESYTRFAATFGVFYTLVPRVRVAAQMLQRVRDCAARAGIVLPELTTGRDQQAPVAQ
ncbi:hypothetical protein BJX66DRAFT_326264 [Aspergillus keveii]|uniref:C6 transcription factor n=1 Tax=Aspergillus keveii TaxID=714993 RepID=A0ABR4G238_9EURO